MPCGGAEVWRDLFWFVGVVTPRRERQCAAVAWDDAEKVMICPDAECCFGLG